MRRPGPGAGVRATGVGLGARGTRTDEREHGTLRSRAKSARRLMEYKVPLITMLTGAQGLA